MRKDLDIEFEGFTETERTLNIEVSYEFRDHGFAERNYISDPVQWSNLFHWKGPHDRWRVHFPTKPHETEEDILAETNLHRLLRPYIDFKADLHHPRVEPLYGAPARGEEVPRRPLHPCRRQRAHQQPDRGDGPQQRRARRLQSGGQADRDLRTATPTRACSTATSASAATSRLAHTQADTIQNKRRLAEQDPAVRRKNQDQLRRTSEDPVAARKFLLRTALFDSLREAEAIE